MMLRRARLPSMLRTARAVKVAITSSPPQPASPGRVAIRARPQHNAMLRGAPA
jgi:hypothetical protein